MTGEPPEFAGLTLGKVQIFLLEGDTSPSSEVAAAYFRVGDADQLFQYHRANGVEVTCKIDDRRYGIDTINAIRDRPFGQSRRLTIAGRLSVAHSHPLRGTRKEKGPAPSKRKAGLNPKLLR